jgi:hypothetical protein
VVSVADGGGVVRGAARRPIVGADKMARYLVGGLSKLDQPFTARPIWVNGQPGVRVEVAGELVGAVSMDIEDGRIARLYSVANPDKLGWLDEEAALTR